MRKIKVQNNYRPHQVAREQLDYFINQRGMSFHAAVNTALDRMYRDENLDQEGNASELSKLRASNASLADDGAKLRLEIADLREELKMMKTEC